MGGIIVTMGGQMDNQQGVLMMEEHLFERLARERNITVEEMRAIISGRIEKGWNDPNPEKRVQWRKIPCAGEVPTPDEYLDYVLKKVYEEGREDLLKNIPLATNSVSY